MSGLPGDRKPAPPGMDPGLMEILVCPCSGGDLVYDQERQFLVCHSAGLAYPVRDGIPMLVREEAVREESIYQGEEPASGLSPPGVPSA